jgi:hypothetical protein
VCYGFWVSSERDYRQSVALLALFCVGFVGACAQANDRCGGNAVHVVQAASYDRRCAVDSDCVAIGEGNACEACALDCPNAAIARSALSHYQSEVGAAVAPGGRLLRCAVSCALPPVACCVEGACRGPRACSMDAGTE